MRLRYFAFVEDDCDCVVPELQPNRYAAFYHILSHAFPYEPEVVGVCAFRLPLGVGKPKSRTSY
jgi:hypothetical protein